MKIFSTAILLLALHAACANLEKFHAGGVEFACRAPARLKENSGIMVLFGGRNWDAEKTIKTFNFDALADKHCLVLLSPSFKDKEYWQPEKWSGEVLKLALGFVEKKYALKIKKILIYGYSAGVQCSNLFYNYMPEHVAAWGLHACGVYPENPLKNAAPAFVTCGVNDADRVRISKNFIYKYREGGGRLVLKLYAGGHELNQEALNFARQFFCDIIEKKDAKYVGEDDTARIVDIDKAGEIDREFRNYLTSDAMKKLWAEE